jgi:hypothetical protein
MFGCDLATAGVPADGTSGRYCHAVPHAARQAGRDTPETVRLAWLCRCWVQPAHRCGGRNRETAKRPPGTSGVCTYAADEVGQCLVTFQQHRCCAVGMPSASPSGPPESFRAPDPAGSRQPHGRRYAAIPCSARRTSALFTADAPATLAGHR